MMIGKRYNGRSPQRHRLPILESPGNQLSPLFIIPAIHACQVVRSRTQVYPGRPRVEGGVGVGARGPVPGRAIDRIEVDLAGSLELRGVLVQRALALPVVEDTRRVLPLLRGLAPVAG